MMNEPLVTPDDPAAVLEILAEHAMVAAHYLLKFASSGSMAETAARGLISVINTEVRAALGDVFTPMCAVCGTTDPSTSDVHRQHS